MKTVLISTQPQWCKLIASGKKRIEVRKTKPKIEVPFKAYIYCTKAKNHFSIGGGVYATSDTLYRLPTGEIKFGDGFELMVDWSGQYDENNFLNGKVIGEFVCDKIDEYRYGVYDGEFAYHIPTVDGEKTCMEYTEAEEYGNGKPLYFLYISNLVVYDKPKELSEFYQKCKSYDKDEFENDDCLYCENPCGNGGKLYLKRPPKSWCYVEEVTK